MAPPYCEICSYRQPRSRSVYHLHYSSAETRITQGVEWSTNNRCYMCPTCQVHHPARLDNGLNVCLSDSQLHQFHIPREPGVSCPPDEIHVDWATIPGGTIPDLETAYVADYAKYKQPQRVLLVAGINDLLKVLPLVVGKLTLGSFVKYFPTMKLVFSLSFPRMRAAS